MHSSTHAFSSTLYRSLSVFLFGMLLPAGMHADTFGDFSYSVSAGSVTITDYTGTASTLAIPEQIAGMPVTSIGYRAFHGCSELNSVSIPHTVSRIEDEAFSYCNGLGSVTLPDSVSFIGNYAFYRCSGLNSVNIPNGVTSIGDEAFFYCCSLTSITIPESVTSIGDYAFNYCSGLTSVTISSSLTEIGYGVFSDCSALISVNIPENVTRIGKEAFSGCSALTSVKIPENITSIQDFAFSGCHKLKSAWYFGNAPAMGMNTFSNATDSFSIYYLTGVTGFSSPIWEGYAAELFSSRYAHWSTTTLNGSEAELNADPDADGISNFMEYAMGTNPAVHNVTDVKPVFVPAGNEMNFEIHCRADDPELMFIYEQSTDLNNWEPVNLSFNSDNETWTASSNSLEIKSASDLGQNIWKLNLGTARNNTAFYRMKIQLQP